MQFPVRGVEGKDILRHTSRVKLKNVAFVGDQEKSNVPIVVAQATFRSKLKTKSSCSGNLEVKNGFRI